MGLEVEPRHLELMQVPKIHWNATLSQIPAACPHVKPLGAYCQAMADNLANGKGLLLYGEYGMGKSACAAICLKAALSVCNVLGTWVRASRVAGIEIEKVMYDPTTSMADRMRFRAPLLVLDEVIISKGGGYSERVIEDIVRCRTDAMLSTVITTNFDLKDFKTLYPAMYAVLTESMTPIPVKGHNFREAKLK